MNVKVITTALPVFSLRCLIHESSVIGEAIKNSSVGLFRRSEGNGCNDLTENKYFDSALESGILLLPRESDGDGRRNPTDLKAQESRRPLEAAFFLRCPILGF